MVAQPHPLIDRGLYKLFDKDSLDGSLNAQCSLVLHHNDTTGVLEASFISWVKPFRNLEGRRVSLDNANGIIYPSTFIDRVCYSKCFMILPSIGARVRKQVREQVQSWVLRLRDIYEVSVDGIVHDMSMSAKCMACVFNRECDDASGSAFSGDCGVRRCAFCLQYFHQSCSDQLADNIENFRSMHPVKLLSDHSIAPKDVPFPLMLTA